MFLLNPEKSADNLSPIVYILCVPLCSQEKLGPIE
jgi:hypothetical protein